MKKYCFILIMGAVFWPFASVLLAQEPTTPVIIIMADQLRYDAIGTHTPHISKLKSESVSFNYTYCASPICVPSRGAFFTGKYPNNNGSLINGWVGADEKYREVKSGLPTLYSVMEKQWDSWHVGKQHLFTADKIDEDPNSATHWITLQTYKKWAKEKGVKTPGGKIFKADAPELISNDYTSTKSYSIPAYKVYEPGLKNFEDDYFASKAIEAINGNGKGNPLLLNLMFLSPHPPYDIPEPYYSRYSVAELNIPDNVGHWDKGQSPLQLYNLTGFFGTRYNREQWSQIWTKYFGLVSLLDDEVGRVLDALKQKGIYDKAIIIFTADHGEMLGSHSLWQKMCMYEESARVPLMIKFPSGFHPANRSIDEKVSLIDVWPTLIDYLKISNAGNVDGRSLMPLIANTNRNRGPVFIQYDGNGAYGNNQRCVVDGKWKLIVDSFKDEYYLELYNLVQDPEERENLALNASDKSQVLQLLQKLQKHMLSTNDLIQFPTTIYDDFMKRYANSANGKQADE